LCKLLYLALLLGALGSRLAWSSGDPIFNVRGGTNSVGFGFCATRMLTEKWLINLDAAVSQLRGSAANSPITEARTQRALAVSVDYRW
jgi:MipA family protein